MDGSFDLVKRGDAFAFEIAATGFGEDRFRHKAILNPQRVLHRRPEILLHLTHRSHAQTIRLNRHPVNALALYPVPDLESGKKYWFRVTASNAHGQGPWSQPVCVRVK